MNSIVQEASSTIKAIQQAWEKAGKPTKFSVRIFEEAEKNFFGITNKPAKIAFLFESKDLPQKTFTQYKPETPKVEAPKPEYHKPQTNHPASVQKQPTQRTFEPKKEIKREIVERKPEQPKIIHQAKPEPTQTAQRQIISPEQQKPSEPKLNNALWTDEMVAIARNWMKDTLEKAGYQATFSTEAKRYHLKFSFAKPLEEDDAKQKNLFRNFAHLIMQTIRNRLKKQLKFHKVIITSEQAQNK